MQTRPARGRPPAPELQGLGARRGFLPARGHRTAGSARRGCAAGGRRGEAGARGAPCRPARPPGSGLGLPPRPRGLGQSRRRRGLGTPSRGARPLGAGPWGPTAEPGRLRRGGALTRGLRARARRGPGGEAGRARLPAQEGGGGQSEEPAAGAPRHRQRQQRRQRAEPGARVGPPAAEPSHVPRSDAPPPVGPAPAQAPPPPSPAPRRPRPRQAPPPASPRLGEGRGGEARSFAARCRERAPRRPPSAPPRASSDRLVHRSPSDRPGDGASGGGRTTFGVL
ncbi:translation initiation factor IF-2-like isoform X1 [Canis lupus familiaris]|uniref:translation initiation factor IF-2-like isoform X1 n=1 Tax=Canis lupus familiaris TaxID=9615 RepID=UPI0018F5B4EF|nr:translation initiation factor IF-2-like isoform X1 [Canis lupus familiaris]